MDLSLPIPKEESKSLYTRTSSVTLEKCFKEFSKEEWFDIDTGYKCESCKKTSKISKKLSIYRFPPLLVIHLKRFHYSSWRRDKLNTSVKFPVEDLDLSKYSENDNADTSEHTYHLYGISHHSGYMSGGHYVADIKNVSGDGKWYHCDDSYISSITEPDNCGSSPYVLFYYRSDIAKQFQNKL